MGKSAGNSNTSTLSLFLQMGRLLRTRMQASMPLPFAQCEILSFVAQHRSPAMHDMARYFNITAPSATSLVEGLVRGGYLKRTRDPRDRRSVHVTLTASGKRAASAVGKSRKKVLSDVITGLSAADRREFNRILGKIVNL